jgi:hypothetical protein
MKDPYEKVRDQFLRELKDFSSGKRQKYPELLAEPLYVDPKLWGRKSTDKRLTRAQHQEQLRYRQEIIEKYRTRWRLLCLLCGMDPVMPRSKAAWQELCRRLAVRHVPGLRTTNTPPQPKKQRGAPRKRGPFFPVELFVAVNDARARVAEKQNKAVDKVSIPTAIQNLPRKFLDEWKLLDKWKSKTYRDKLIRSLETRYYEAKRIWRRRSQPTPLQELGQHLLEKIEKRYINPKPD